MITTKMKILFLDIETSPNTAHVWGLWDQNIGLNQLLETSKVLCWAAKWYGKQGIMYESIYQSNPKAMLKSVYCLLEEADAVVHFNGTKFDIPTLNKEFLLHGFRPPQPVKQIDLLKVCRNRFRFPSNRLDYIANILGLGTKRKVGHELWIGCMENDPKSWKEMEKYNKHDVKLLEGVYGKLLPWIKDHANYNLYGDHSLVCPNCGSTHYQRRGIAITRTLRYTRHSCNNCGTWFRGAKSQGPKATEKYIQI